MSFIFLRNRVTGGAAFSPASLFASGEEGAWYEPSTTTCFTDTAGTTAATYGNAVARINDLSGNGNHATQGTEPARPILARVPEGGRRNELSETDTLATQSVTVTAAERTLSFTGTGTVTLTGASTAGPLVGTGAGDRVSLTFTPSAGSLTLTVLGTVTDAQLELGASATTYQSVADSLGYDITEAGVTSLEYLDFDGTDDFMLHTVNVETAIAAAVSVSSSQTGYRGIFASGSVGSGSMLLSRGGTSDYGTFAGATYYPSGTVLTSSPNVVVMEGTSSGTFYTDGVSDGTYSAASGQSAKHIGGLASAGQEANINLFALIALDRAFGSDRINTETYLASKSGVTL